MEYTCHVVKGNDAHCSSAKVFWKMQDEGLDRVVIYDSKAPSIVDWHHVTNNNIACLIRIVDEQGAMVAVAWLNSFMGRTAFIHFCVFKVGRHDAVHIGNALLRFVLKSGKFDALVGITPSTYRHALNYVAKLGFVQKMRIPSACFLAKHERYVDGVVTLLKREDFMKGGG